MLEPSAVSHQLSVLSYQLSVISSLILFGAALRMESLCLEGGGALSLKLNENFNKNCTDAGFLEYGIGGITGITGIGGISWFGWFGWFSWFSWFGWGAWDKWDKWQSTFFRQRHL